MDVYFKTKKRKWFIFLFTYKLENINGEKKKIFSTPIEECIISLICSKITDQNLTIFYESSHIQWDQNACVYYSI